MNRREWIVYILRGLIVGVAIIGAMVMMTGCSSLDGNLVRVMEPPLTKVDIAEISANLRDSQGVIVDYGFTSLQPGSDIDIGADATLSVGVVKELIGMGAAMQGGDNAAKAIGDVLGKNRESKVTVMIADSADLVRMRQSDNSAKLTPGHRTVDILSRAALTNILEEWQYLIAQLEASRPEPGQGGPVPDPPTGDSPPDLSPGDGSADPGGDEPPTGDDTFLWKPRADVRQPDGTHQRVGNLVVLTPATLQGATLAVNGERLAAAGRGNGNRQHWRSGKHGSAYSAPASVVMTATDGRVYRWTVPISGKRYEAGKPAPEGQPDPEPEDPAPAQAWFRWEPAGDVVHVFIPTVYRAWRLSVLTAAGHKHVHPFGSESVWWWDDDGTPQGDGLTRYVIPVSAEVLRQRALGFGVASGDLLMMFAKTRVVPPGATNADVSWFVRPTEAVSDGPDANIRNTDNNWRGRL
jgi:hypothetical protein